MCIAQVGLKTHSPLSPGGRIVGMQHRAHVCTSVLLCVNVHARGCLS